MRALDLARKSLHTPPRAVARELGRRLWELSTTTAYRQRHRFFPTYSRRKALGLRCILPALEVGWDGRSGDTLAGVCGHYLGHRFDLLGSGWTEVAYGRSYRGTEGISFARGAPVEPDVAGTWLEGRVNAVNLARAKSTWGLVSPGYRPIDWHADFKSGFRWPSTGWYRDIAYGSVRGADVKVPWELARAQHLPRLALAYGAARRGDPRFLAPERYSQEVTDQILDFIATNPPRYGVNWRCTMDVGIRVANWLLACDLLRGFGAELDRRFMSVLAGSVFDHGLFIAQNLEWHPVFRSNHYLADISGLAFAAAYLEDVSSHRRPPEAERWLALATRELASEARSQFYADGANKEASVCYHRLSTEMLVYTTALVSSTGAPQEWRQCQLAAVERALGFTAWAMKDGRQVAQIGDNDSGRFFALAPLPAAMTVGEAKKRWSNLDGYDELDADDVFWAQDTLDHTHLLVSGQALLASRAPDSLAHVIAAELAWAAGGIDGRVVHDECRQRWRGAPLPVGVAGGPHRPELDVSALAAGGAHDIVYWRVQPGGSWLADGLEAAAFPDFGLFVLRSSRLYLAIRCGPVGQAGSGGHSHNDQLGMEIEIDGRPWFRDPGSYLYTPGPEARNAYRSVRAHLVPRRGTEEPGDLHAGLFLLPERANAQCLYFGPAGFSGVHYGYGLPTVRQMKLTDTALEVADAVPRAAGARSVDGPARSFTRPEQLMAFAGPGVGFSPGYGWVERDRG